MPPVDVEQLLAVGPSVGIDPPLWTPDGTHVLAVGGLGGSADLWAFPVDGGPAERVSAGMGAVGHLSSPLTRLAPDGSCVAHVRGDIGRTEVWLQPLDGDPARRLSRLGADIIGLDWAPDGDSLLVTANRRGTYDVYELDVADGSHRRLTDDEAYEVGPTWAPDGSARYHVRLDATWTEHLVVRVPAGGGVADERVLVHDTRFFDYQYGRVFGTPRVAPDGGTVLFRSYRSDWINVWAVRAEGGEAWPLAPAEADQGEPCWSPDGSHVVMTSNRDASVGLILVDVRDGTVRDLVAPGDGVCAAPSWSPDGTRVAFSLARPTHAADLHVVEVATGEVRRLTRSVPAAVEARLGTPSRIAYEGEDGLRIPAFLLRPTDVGAAPNGAGVVLVHGGPTMQWFPTWEPYAQFLAARGYTVLLPNIRGSSGYGRAFEEANDRDWLGGDLRDVVRGAAYLRGLPEVDAARLAVTGLSYGGIMSMGAVTLAPGEFAAAAALSGYGDFLHMMEEQEYRHQQLLRKELGDPVADREVYERASSILRVRDAGTPLFMAHGVGRFPQSDASRRFAEAMQREYKPFEYRTYDGEHYYVYGRDNTRRLWADVDRFLRTYLELPEA